MITSTPHRQSDRNDTTPEFRTPRPPQQFNAFYIIHKEVAAAALEKIQSLLDAGTVHSTNLVPPGTDIDLIDESVFVFPGSHMPANSLSEMPAIKALLKDLVALKMHGAEVELVCVNERQEELDWEVPFLLHHPEESERVTPHTLHEVGEFCKEVLRTIPAALIAAKRFMWEEDGAGRPKRTKVCTPNETTT